jgi:uncharacterized membrane protein
VGQWLGQMMETKKRTVVRMITYRITAWLFTIFYTWLFTGSIAAATGFATALHILLSVDYYIHERIWLKVKWGLK